MEVLIHDIVVGDVVPLKIGDQVCADGVLISGHSVAIDESSMTGESKTVAKDSDSPFVMAGCNVTDGYGTMLVTLVGVDTGWGMLMASISEDAGEETPFQIRLNGLATKMGKAGLQVAFVVLIVLLARFFTGHMNAVGMPKFKAGKTSASYAIDGAIKIITVAIYRTAKFFVCSIYASLDLSDDVYSWTSCVGCRTSDRSSYAQTTC